MSYTARHRLYGHRKFKRWKRRFNATIRSNKPFYDHMQQCQAILNQRIEQEDRRMLAIINEAADMIAGPTL